MKKQILLAALFLFMNGCRDITVSTKVNSNGTVERSISISSESSDAREHLFPYQLDDTWKVSAKKNKENKNTYTFSKSFSNFDSYNSEFKNKGNSTSSVKKEFRWFYTYYTFHEKYKSYNELNLIPAEQYFSKADLARIDKGEDTVWINKQTEKWQQRNLCEEVYLSLVDAAQRLKTSDITPASLKAKKEELFRRMLDEKDDISEMANLLNELFNTREGSLFREDLKRVNTEIGSKMESMGRAEGDYKNEVTLPGIIVKTNADALLGNKAMWNFNSDKYLIKDYEMYAESRELNSMFITISGIVVILLIGGLSVPFFRRK